MALLAYHLQQTIPAPAVVTPARAPTLPRGAGVHVIGGSSSEAHYALADSFRKSSRVGEWARRTGSDPEVIRHYFGGTGGH